MNKEIDIIEWMQKEGYDRKASQEIAPIIAKFTNTHNVDISKWISVKEKLPPLNENVLGFGIEKSIKVWDFCCVTTKGFKMQSTTNKKVNITHWMPLPNTPTEK